MTFREVSKPMDKPSLCSHQGVGFETARLNQALRRLRMTDHQRQAVGWLVERNSGEAACLRGQVHCCEVEMRLLLIRHRPVCSELKTRSRQLCAAIAALNWLRLEFNAELHQLLSNSQSQALLAAYPISHSLASRTKLPYLLEQSCQRLFSLTLRDTQRRGMEAVLRGSEGQLKELRRKRDLARDRVLGQIRGKAPNLGKIHPFFQEWESLAGDCHWAWLEMTVLLSYFLSAEQGACFRLLTTAQAEDRLGP